MYNASISLQTNSPLAMSSLIVPASCSPLFRANACLARTLKCWYPWGQSLPKYSSWRQVQNKSCHSHNRRSTIHKHTCLVYIGSVLYLRHAIGSTNLLVEPQNFSSQLQRHPPLLIILIFPFLQRTIRYKAAYLRFTVSIITEGTGFKVQILLELARTISH